MPGESTATFPVKSASVPTADVRAHLREDPFELLWADRLALLPSLPDAHY